MRVYGTLLLLSVMLVALPFAQADLGTAPAWSPDWGPWPITPPAVSGINTKGISSAVAGNAVQVAFPNNLHPMPLVGTPADYAAARAMAAQVPEPAIPSMPLVETPHDRSVKAIEVPNGATVLLDGTTVTGGTGIGSSGIGTLFAPPDPPAIPYHLDNIGGNGYGIPSFNMPALPGP